MTCDLNHGWLKSDGPTATDFSTPQKRQRKMHITRYNGYRIFLGSQAGSPDLFCAEAYYFEPEDFDENNVYSGGFQSIEEAKKQVDYDLNRLAIEALEDGLSI